MLRKTTTTLLAPFYLASLMLKPEVFQACFNLLFFLFNFCQPQKTNSPSVITFTLQSMFYLIYISCNYIFSQGEKNSITFAPPLALDFVIYSCDWKVVRRRIHSRVHITKNADLFLQVVSPVSLFQSSFFSNLDTLAATVSGTPIYLCISDFWKPRVEQGYPVG